MFKIIFCVIFVLIEPIVSQRHNIEPFRDIFGNIVGIDSKHAYMYKVDKGQNYTVSIALFKN